MSNTAVTTAPPSHPQATVGPTLPAPPARPAPPGFWQQVLLIVRKDLLLEWRGRTRVNATVFFAVMTLLLFSFAVGPHQTMLTRNAPGFLWLSIFLASVLSLGESMRLENDNDALDGLRLLPIAPPAIFAAKAIVNTVFLFALGLIVTPLALALYDTGLALGVAPMLAVLFLGAAAVSAPGTVHATLAVKTRAKDVLLPLLLFPVLVPGLLAAVKATTLVMAGDPMGQLNSWLLLLGVFNLIYWLLCGALFGRVLEE